MNYQNFMNIPIGNFRFNFCEIELNKVAVTYFQEGSIFRQVLFHNEKSIAEAYANVMRFIKGEFLPPFKQLLLTEGKKNSSSDPDVIEGMFYSFPYEIKYLGVVENNVHSYTFSVPIGYDFLKKEVVYRMIGIEKESLCSTLFLKNIAYSLIEEFRESVRTNSSEAYIW